MRNGKISLPLLVLFQQPQSFHFLVNNNNYVICYQHIHVRIKIHTQNLHTVTNLHLFILIIILAIPLNSVILMTTGHVFKVLCGLSPMISLTYNETISSTLQITQRTPGEIKGPVHRFLELEAEAG